jgi:hypothetical protein
MPLLMEAVRGGGGIVFQAGPDMQQPRAPIDLPIHFGATSTFLPGCHLRVSATM